MNAAIADKKKETCDFYIWESLRLASDIKETTAAAVKQVQSQNELLDHGIRKLDHTEHNMQRAISKINKTLQEHKTFAVVSLITFAFLSVCTLNLLLLMRDKSA